jgi:ectoine hydroxylase-related dioxygenase (phytanoyl-CoA dioxygenase family)
MLPSRVRWKGRSLSGLVLGKEPMSVDEAYRMYREEGYGVVRGVLDTRQIDRVLEEADRLYAMGSRFNATSEDGHVKWLVVPRPSSTPVLRGLQNGYRISPTLDSIRTSDDVLAVLEPMIGSNINAVVNTLFWKAPGEPDTAIAYHQDSVFRKPVERYRNLAASFVQFGLAIDPHGPANGGMRVVAGSHLVGDLEIQRTSSVMMDSPESMDLDAYGLSKSQEVDVDLQPGDAVFWHPHLLHGSPPNLSPTLNRRFFVTGYMRSLDCDGGDPAFRDGKSCVWQ